MRRLPVSAFAVLVGLTVAAFFITQHLKTVTPLVLSRGYGPPGPDPAGINPNNHAHTCKNVFGQRVACNVTKLRIRLQHGSEKVEVFVVNRSGDAVDTLSSGRFLAQGNLGVFSWNGRNTSGRVVHEGTYYFRIELADGGGEELTDRPISVITKDPKPVITGVTPSVIEPGSSQATIHFRTDGYTGAQVLIYRTTARGRLTLVSSPRFLTSPSNGKAIWNGLLAGKPAPAGTYMVGLRLRDAAGNYGTTPAGTDVVPGTTPGMGVTVRYIAAEPPLTPTAAGQSATVYVDSQQHAYTWQLRAIGARKALEHGSVKANATPELHVPMPGKRAGLYELRVVAGSHRTTVPLIASAKAGSPHVLVVLPMLTWQGKNPVDEDGDGLPQTLAAGDSIRLPQPLVRGLPAGFEAEAQLLAYLKSRHVAYDLTTDVALARGAGPSLPGRRGVLLDGSFTWLPSSVASQLRGYVKGGGRVASIGLNSMQRQVKLLGSDADLHTGTASPLRPDPFGARHGAVTGTDGELVTVLSDKLGLFGDTPALQGVERYQSIVPPTRAATSLAGVAESAPAVAGFTLGSGQVVEVGIEGFVGSLAHNVDSQELMSSITKSLGGSS